MNSAEALGPLFESWIRALGPWGYLVVGLAALLEYVFPPFPGDTVALLGGAWAEQGERSWPLVLLALTVGSLGGITSSWAFGRWAGVRVDRRPGERVLPGVTHEQLHRAQAAMRARGDWLLVLNRFLPAFRSVVFIAAGAAGLPLPRVLALGSLSALAWNGLLVATGAVVGEHAEAWSPWLWRYRIAGGVVVGLVAAGWVVRWVVQRRRAAR